MSGLFDFESLDEAAEDVRADQDTQVELETVPTAA